MSDYRTCWVFTFSCRGLRMLAEAFLVSTETSERMTRFSIGAQKQRTTWTILRVLCTWCNDVISQLLGEGTSVNCAHNEGYLKLCASIVDLTNFCTKSVPCRYKWESRISKPFEILRAWNKIISTLQVQCTGLQYNIVIITICYHQHYFRLHHKMPVCLDSCLSQNSTALHFIVQKPC